MDNQQETFEIMRVGEEAGGTSTLDRLQDKLDNNIDRLKADAEFTLSENPDCKQYVENQSLDDAYSNAVWDAGYYAGLMRAVEVLEDCDD